MFKNLSLKKVVYSSLGLFLVCPHTTFAESFTNFTLDKLPVKGFYAEKFSHDGAWVAGSTPQNKLALFSVRERKFTKVAEVITREILLRGACVGYHSKTICVPKRLYCSYGA